MTIYVLGWANVVIAEDRRPDPSHEELREKVRTCLTYHYGQPEDVSRRSPWELMHWALAYGVDAEVTVRGHPRNAIGWLCWNGSCGGQRLFGLSAGKLTALEGAGLQGHPGQFLAVLAQCRVRRENLMKVDGRDFNVTDLIEYEQFNCSSGADLSFKLIGLAYYLDTESTWEARDGDSWSISRLIKEELTQPVVQAAPCGGTHRLMALSYAVRKRSEEGHPFEGQWRSAQTYVREFQEYAFEFQNPDGSFSTEWFRERGARDDVARRVQTTGHMLEWLTYLLPPKELTQPRVTKSVEHLTELLHDNPSRRWEIGPQGHALHALAMYYERVFEGATACNDPMLDAGN
ncbi:MAG: hypothetical protein H8E66_23495 [Planctomycetes bacterium]|nr:hypothetical protein [Planctomycetota bacterium]